MTSQDILFSVIRLRKSLFADKLDILAQLHDKADASAVPIPPELRIIVSAIGYNDAASRRHQVVSALREGTF